MGGAVPLWIFHNLAHLLTRLLAGGDSFAIKDFWKWTGKKKLSLPLGIIVEYKGDI